MQQRRTKKSRREANDKCLALPLSFTDRPSPIRPSVRPSAGEDLRAKPPIKMKTFLGRLSLSLFLLQSWKAEIPEALDNWRHDSNEWRTGGKMLAGE